jgi:hypothetical protein
MSGVFSASERELLERAVKALETIAMAELWVDLTREDDDTTFQDLIETYQAFVKSAERVKKESTA